MQRIASLELHYCNQKAAYSTVRAMVRYQGRVITDYFTANSTFIPQKRPFPSDCVGEGSNVHQRQSSSLSPLPTPNSTNGLPNGSYSHAFEGPQKDTIGSVSASKTKELFQENHTLTLRGSFEAPSTQTSALPSSQRIVKDGEVMIRNSDDELGSDASSLEDLDKILNKNGDMTSTPEPRLPYLPAEALSAERKRRVVKKKARRASSPLPVRPSPKFSLQDLAKQRRDYECSRKCIAEARDLLKAQQGKENRKDVPDGHLIDDLMQDHADLEDIDRLKVAIQRTEALHYDETWSFFDAHAKTKPFSTPEFPSFEDETLGALLSDNTLRQQTFMSGFVEDYAKKAPLPEELLLWILDASYSEPRDDLRQAYANTLREASEQIASILTVDCLNSVFEKVGASAVALNIEEPVLPRATFPEGSQNDERLSLLFILELLRRVSSTLGIDTRTHAVSLLCRLLLDENIINNGRLLNSLEHTLTSLFQQASFSDPESQAQFVETILLRLYNCTTSPSLRVQLLRNLPFLSPQWLYLRRQLALSFFFSDPSYLTYPPRKPFSLSKISTHLSTSTFDITNDTDYTALTSSIIILDIAIDAADRPTNITPLNNALSTTPDESQPKPQSEQDSNAPKFNKTLDTLTSKIKSMFMQIIDSGASNMRRTEAKEVLEMFHSRLLYAVRTKPPLSRKMVFLMGGENGGEGEEGEVGRERKGMRQFLEAGKG